MVGLYFVIFTNLQLDVISLIHKLNNNNYGISSSIYFSNNNNNKSTVKKANKLNSSIKKNCVAKP